MTEASDVDPQETREWIESIEAVIAHDGAARARMLLGQVIDRAHELGAAPGGRPVTPYRNTVAAADEEPYPGDEDVERELLRMMRWNAAMLVSHANKHYDGIGGHMSTYASSSTFLEVGLNHVFRGKDAEGRGDQMYFQGHGSPGLYARAFLEGRLTLEQMLRFRRETERGAGLSSYPHPRLMPEFWEFPTVSMGLGPLNAIYQARFNRYLQARGICDTSASRVWCFLGDGECDEPESLGALHIAAREKLDNLIFVVNCNLQRLDGPVRGNGKVIQELESIFRGNGWNVVKCLWGSGFDELFAADDDDVLIDALAEIVDGAWQHFTDLDDPEQRKAFFAQTEELQALWDRAGSDDLTLCRGGHDFVKVWNAYRAALAHEGGPSVILFHTVKGFGLGPAFEGSNVTHQMKKLSKEQLLDLRDRLEIPVPDEQLEEQPFVTPEDGDQAIAYLRERRKELGGPLPQRRVDLVEKGLKVPEGEIWSDFEAGSKGRELSTTMAFVAVLGKLLKDESLGRRIVPIVPDEARTFGMDALFRSIGIYSPGGQQYEPVDKKMLMYYRESADGQLLEEGITEAGSMASFTAAGTSYAVHGQPMIPFFIFYSMFGFQRVGDLIWSFGDARGRGFLLGATAGRTTLNGEGLQHEDGHSLLLASTVPNVRAYDPAYAFEVAFIVKDGLKRMVGGNEDVFYYLTLHNENYAMPPVPDRPGVEEGCVRGMYLFREADARQILHVQILASGVMLNHALEAQQILAERFNVSSDVWSVTSYQLLRNDALACERHNRLKPKSKPVQSFIEKTLGDREGPFVAVSDFMKAVPDQIARFLPGRLHVLGTDGFGMSDTRERLRRHFEVDVAHIVVAALDALRQQGSTKPADVAKAIKELGIDPDKLAPMDV